MASVADSAINQSYAPPPADSGVAAFVDRWIWVFTTALIILTVLGGFVPDSLKKVAMVQAGQRPPFPVVLHVHAVLMAAWMALLLAQTTLMAMGHRKWHMQLGLAAMGLAPAIVVTGLVLVPTMYGMGWHGLQTANPQLPAAALAPRMAYSSNILLLQMRLALVFPVLIALGLGARKRDPGLHKRLMILASWVPISAAIQRISWLPTTMPENPLAVNLYPLAVIAPMFLWDAYRLRRIHPAYVIAFLVMLPFEMASQGLWNSQWWLAAVPQMMGVQ